MCYNHSFYIKPNSDCKSIKAEEPRHYPATDPKVQTGSILAPNLTLCHPKTDSSILINGLVTGKAKILGKKMKEKKKRKKKRKVTTTGNISLVFMNITSVFKLQTACKLPLNLTLLSTKEGFIDLN